jgi:hypothetical protein
MITVDTDEEVIDVDAANAFDQLSSIPVSR